MKYMVFDAPNADGSISERLEAARVALASVGGTRATVLQHTVCTGHDHVTSELSRIESQGGEGLMLAKSGVQHKGGRGPNNLKVKSMHTDDAVVVGHTAGKGRHLGRVGALSCKNRQGGVFDVGTGLKDHERVAPGVPAVGTVIEYAFFEKSRAGVPRFPTFKRKREDLDPW